MNILQTLAVAFSMFSALPMPQFEWNKKNMRFALAAFPLVGVVIGLAMYGWTYCVDWLCLPGVLRGAGLCLLPAVITGGIHLDGFADTWDALSSHGSVEKKQAILKDPHMGAFAAIHLCMYFLFSFGLWSSAVSLNVAQFVSMFVFSRALSGLAVATFPMAPHTGLAHTFADAADKGRVAVILFLQTAIFGGILCIGGISGIAMVLAALTVFAYYRTGLQRQFGGISGDLAGWFLQMAELAMLAAHVFVCYLEAAL